MRQFRVSVAEWKIMQLSFIAGVEQQIPLPFPARKLFH